jgi:hypothetical protein
MKHQGKREIQMIIHYRVDEYIQVAIPRNRTLKTI